jgi:hypothetical protein
VCLGVNRNVTGFKSGLFLCVSRHKLVDVKDVAYSVRQVNVLHAEVCKYQVRYTHFT